MKSLAELRDERRAREVALAKSQGLDIMNICGWGEGKIDPIKDELLACSTDYAEAAAELADELTAMTADELADWFASIEWEPVGARKSERITDYLRRG